MKGVDNEDLGFFEWVELQWDLFTIRMGIFFRGLHSIEHNPIYAIRHSETDIRLATGDKKFLDWIKEDKIARHSIKQFVKTNDKFKAWMKKEGLIS